MRLLILVIIISGVIGCSHEKKLSRAKRKLADLVLSYPELVGHDTIWQKDTVVVNGISKDTIFQSIITKDTVTIVRDQLTMKYYSDGKTVYLKGTCDTVKIIREVPVRVNSVNAVKEVHIMRWWDWVIYVIAGLAVLFVILDRLAARKYN